MKAWKSNLANCVLALASVIFVLGCLEAFLWVQASLGQPPSMPVATTVPAPGAWVDGLPPELVAVAKKRQQLLSMPAEWNWIPTSVPGAAHANYWHGNLQVHDQNDMRRTTPFSPRNPAVFRIVVLGDSLTYGDGIAEGATFPSLLNRWLRRDFQVEVFNLGYQGAQSEDILRTLERFLPELKPDLVIYALCLNDFLPSFGGEYGSDYAFPLPESVKEFLTRTTRVGALLDRSYDGTLRRFDLRRDFFDDILQDFEGCQKRLSRDVAEMNRVVRESGLPPMLAMVVDQYPEYGGRGYRISRVAEAALARAGAVVIPTEDYYRRYDGQSLFVSRWEGHPNEVANYIWANMIAERLRDRQDLLRFRR